MFEPAGSQQLPRWHWFPLNDGMGDMETMDGHSRSQRMARADASEAKISNIFSIQLIKTYFIENVCMPCRQKTRKMEAKLSNFFLLSN